MFIVIKALCYHLNFCRLSKTVTFLFSRDLYFSVLNVCGVVLEDTIGKKNYHELGIEAELNFEFFEFYHYIL